MEVSSRLSFRRTLLEVKLKKKKNQKKRHISDTLSSRNGVTWIVQIILEGHLR